LATTQDNKEPKNHELVSKITSCRLAQTALKHQSFKFAKSLKQFGESTLERTQTVPIKHMKQGYGNFLKAFSVQHTNDTRPFW